MVRLWIMALAATFLAARAVWAYSNASPKTPDATRTFVYVMGYPPILLWALESWPQWSLVSPGLFVAGLVWLLACVHLDRVVRDQTKSHPGEFLGFPLRVWAWIAGLTALLSLYFWEP